MKSFIRHLIREEVRHLLELRSSVSKEEAKQIYDALKLTVDFNEFLMGLNIELEHQDVTGGDLKKTAQIALAHLKEVPDYYTKLKKYVEPNVQKEVDDDLTFDDGNGPRKKYSDDSGISGGMGTMMS